MINTYTIKDLIQNIPIVICVHDFSENRCWFRRDVEEMSDIGVNCVTIQAGISMSVDEVTI